MATTSTIAVVQIHCASCENTIRTGLGRTEGVRGVQPDAATNTVTYEENKVSEEDLRRRLADIGFDSVA
ncbi:MAG: heavy-metal-associated domain-containing protein [Catenulispora sp.]|nr:heavy-metal-associated domain-containing protein [Catenulispora sp.]